MFERAAHMRAQKRARGSQTRPRSQGAGRGAMATPASCFRSPFEDRPLRRERSAGAASCSRTGLEATCDAAATRTATQRNPLDVLRAAAHRREVLHDQADELDRPGARRVMRKDHRGPRAPVAEREHRTRPRALTRETREAAARWARHRSNEGFLLGKSCHASELPTRFGCFLP